MILDYDKMSVRRVKNFNFNGFNDSYLYYTSKKYTLKNVIENSVKYLNNYQSITNI